MLGTRAGLPLLAAALLAVACDAPGTDDSSAPPLLSEAPPAVAGMSATALDRIPAAMAAYVEDGRLPGVVTMVARDGRIVHWDAVGYRDVASGEPLERNDVFRIYSMTKPVTSVAALILMEEGALSLEDPVSDHIPEFAGLTVLGAAGEEVPVTAPVTVEHLLTHTAGMTYGFFSDTPVDRIYRESDFFFTARDLAGFAAGAAELPLLFQPGSAWQYGIATDVLGRVVEVASGRSLDDFITERILEPLEMDESGFVVPEEGLDRFVTKYMITEEGLVQADPALGQDSDYTRPPGWLSGGGGMVSTPADYVRFLQMLLDGGTLGDIRILEEETVALMTSDRLPDGMAPLGLLGIFPPAYGFGLGVAVLVDEAATPAPDHAGSYFWTGIANTFFWVDPGADLIAMVWTQVEPFMTYPLDSEFRAMVYQALQEE